MTPTKRPTKEPSAKSAAGTESALLTVLKTMTEVRPESLSGVQRDAARQLRTVLRDKNTVGIGIAEKRRNARGTGKLALVFYVEKKKDLSRVKKALAVPAAVPESLSGGAALVTDVVEIGKLRPEKKPRVTREAISPGYSIGQAHESAGTMGAFVRRGKKLFLLSNSHVLARSGKGKKGDKIIYPGLEDGGVAPQDVIAKLVAFKKFAKGATAYTNRVDCAVAEPLVSVQGRLRPAIDQVGLPRGTIAPKRGMKIVKVGRTTGRTTGTIKDVNFRFLLDYENVGTIGFADQVLCTRYSDAGDSGSLVLDAKTKRAVGLHFAGADGGSVFSPIDAVLKAMKVELVTEAD